MHRRLLTGVVAAAALVVGLTACEPPPRAQLVVDTTAGGSDAAPGDGVCASDEAEGACTVRAAIEEANALGRGDVILPAGDYDASSGGDMTVTGSVAVYGAGIAQTALGGRIVVARSGALRVDRLGSSTGDGAHHLSIQVWGSLHLTRSLIFSPDPPYPVDVAALGGVFVDSSIILGDGGVLNRGNAVISRSTVAGSYAVLETPGDGWTVVRGSWISSEAGLSCATPVTSAGYNHATDDSCPFSTEGDGTGEVYAPSGGALTAPPPPADSALVDAIPVGTAGCVEGEPDIHGNPRGVDGNGDGIGGCDVGAVERQPAAV